MKSNKKRGRKRDDKSLLLFFAFHVSRFPKWKESILTIEGIMAIGQEAIKTILLVAGPMLGLSLVVGLMVSVFQAMTQINEMTLTF